jgi:hypothetical protein
MLSLNSKHVQHVKIYMPCNCEVNLITRHENTLWTLAAMLDFKSAPKTQIW